MREPIDLDYTFVNELSRFGLLFLDSALPLQAFAAGPSTRPPLRMGIFTVTGGTVIESWKPETEDALGKLPSILFSEQFHAVGGDGEMFALMSPDGVNWEGITKVTQNVESLAFGNLDWR